MYLKNPRFNLSSFGDFLVRLLIFSFYVLAVALTVFFAISGSSALRWLSFLLFIFLLDRLIHINEGDRSLAEISKSGKEVNLALGLTPAAFRLLNYSFRKAFILGQDFYFILLEKLLIRKDIKETLRRLDIDWRIFYQKTKEKLRDLPAQNLKKEEGFKLIENLTIAAFNNGLKSGEKFIEPRNLFSALLTINHPPLIKLFELFELSQKGIAEAIIFGRFQKAISGLRRLPATIGGFAHRPYFLRRRVMNRAWTARPTPTLDRFSTDLTDLAKLERVGFLIGHQKEFDQLLNVLSRPGKPNALLVGEPGTGKSTLIAHLAFRIIKDDVPPVLFDKRLISLEIGELLADAPPEVLTGRLQKIAEEIILAGNIVLFIPNIHDLFRRSEKLALNVIDILLPIVKNAAIPLIGETYPREFKQFIEPRSDFLEQFDIVRVEEITEEEALLFLIYHSLILEREFKVFITFKAIVKAVELAHRYFRSKPLPGSAVDLLKQALAKASQEKLKYLREDAIIAVAERQSKVPIQKAGALEAEKLLNLENIIHQRLINQEAAVKAVARALREYRSGLSRAGGPIASFLFVGPTGVGKTELAKILAQTQFGSKEAMIRFDMSEYQDKQSIFRFIGTPDGERTGALTDAVLENPFSLVLLDEFEKAYSDILNLFLQVFDDGRLTDNLGRTADFQNAIIIATSNAHSDFIKTEIEKGKNIEEIAEEIKKKLTDYFRPELINRFSDIIVFRNLNQQEIQAISKLMIKEVIELVRESQGIEILVDDDAVNKIAELGYSPVFGARPLRQVISEKIRSVLAEKILRREIGRGNRIVVTTTDNDFEFKITA